jgi:hypothetical protein
MTKRIMPGRFVALWIDVILHLNVAGSVIPRHRFQTSGLPVNRPEHRSACRGMLWGGLNIVPRALFAISPSA